jgi:hypothetical protein
VNVKQALLQAGDMSLAAHGAVTGLDKVARFRDVDVRSHNLNFDRIRALYPGLDRRTAPARLGGPFVIRATGSGTQDAQQLDVQMDMTTASVDVPDRFAKPKGTPMLVHVRAETPRTSPSSRCRSPTSASSDAGACATCGATRRSSTCGSIPRLLELRA